MKRAYVITATLAPGHVTPPTETVSGPFSFAAFNAATAYCQKHMPGYLAIPGGRFELEGLRFEAINHGAGLGAVLWVREVQA